MTEATNETLSLPADYRVEPGPLHTEGRRIKDRLGRTVILRGPNLSGRHKQPPHICMDTPEGMEPLRRWGFNAIRLVLVWEAIEPERGRMDHDYLDRVEQLSTWAGERGLHVIMDMHQDIYGRTFGGSGAPEWTVATRQWQDPPEPANTWFLRYLYHQGVRRSLDRFWRNEDQLQDHFISAMTEAARRLSGHPEVIGWEPYNEPFPGNLSFKTFEKKILEPFYDRGIRSVREVAPHWMVFLEGALFASEVRLEMDFGSHDNVVYLPHFYIKTAHTARRYDGDHRELDRVLAVYERDAAARGVPWMLGEYGFCNDGHGGGDYLRDHQRALERCGVGGTFWQYNPTGQDWNHEFMSVAGPGGEETELLEALVHPAPLAVAGDVRAFGYDERSRRFELTYTAGAPDLDTVIRLPGRCYPEGIGVRVDGGEFGLAGGGELLVVRARNEGAVRVTAAPAQTR